MPGVAWLLFFSSCIFHFNMQCIGTGLNIYLYCNMSEIGHAIVYSYIITSYELTTEIAGDAPDLRTRCHVESKSTSTQPQHHKVWILMEHG